MTIPVDLGTLRGLSVPEASAAPQPDREPARRNQPAAKPTEPAKDRGIDASQHTREAVDTWRKVEDQARKESTTYVKSPRGIDESGRRNGVTTDWHFRPPVPWTDAHHDEEIQIGGGVQYQQAPPVHVTGDGFASPREMRRRIRRLNEEQAARAYFEEVAKKAPREGLAEAAGVTPRQLRRWIEKGERPSKYHKGR